ncbi:MAG TPA: ThiF family adenylyltransferase, partial [Candidatus Saccharimonadales bacterium]|nr:ThiF family adenylyltransferase [Candidatus Saccharimonadales bacterium]
MGIKTISEPKPQFLEEGSRGLETLKKDASVEVIDYYQNMSEELGSIRKIANISSQIKPGMWVFYPWSKHLLKILDHDDFYDLRTARNKEINTPEEQQKFRKTVIGIGGLSVGNSIALALAYTGGAETMKIADPDILDGSNLNRIRAGLKNLGENKTFIAAKQIYELNPYANLILFPSGLNEENLEEFILGDPVPDILIDEMDNLKLKIFIRLAARAAKKPVIMATDNGDNVIIDVDRFDLNPNAPPFNTLPEMDIKTIAKNINFGESMELGIKERVLLATNIVGPENISPRMQQSLMEVGKTLVSWPQPATSAFTSGPALAYVARKVALGEEVKTGKTHISYDKALLANFDSKEAGEKRAKETQEFVDYIKNLSTEVKKEAYMIWDTDEKEFPSAGSEEEQIKFLLNYAIMAPSTHNTQPWKFKIEGNKIHVFVDPERALPISDPTKRQAFLSLGTLITNLEIAAGHLGFSVEKSEFPTSDQNLVATFTLKKGSPKPNELFPSIKDRLSNRSEYNKKPLETGLVAKINQLNSDSELELKVITEEKTISEISDLIFEGTKQMMAYKEFREELSDWL